MMWEIAKLGDISKNIQTGPFGSQLHQSDYSECGIPVVMPKDLVGGKISEKSIARVDKTHVERLCRHKIEVGDILYSRRGDVGRCAHVTKKEEGWLCGTGCLRVTIDSEKADSRFVFFQLQHPDTVGWVEKHAVGATMLNLNTTILSSVPIRLPALEIQKRIADILSAYDDLIENNQKQIKLLEEAVQRLYKEWFVNLRFPGHENTKIVDGVPEGWHRGTIGQIAEFKRGRTITKAQVKEGNVPVIAGGLEPAYYHNVANTKAPVITISASGANAGFVRLYGVDVFASDCSFVDGLGTESLFFVYEFLKESKVSIDQLQKGSAQPHVYAKDINAMKITIPEKEYLERFDRYAKVYFNKIKTLQGQNERLKTARDLLLPKLMSGEAEV